MTIIDDGITVTLWRFASPTNKKHIREIADQVTALLWGLA